ncbi:conserved hypothetical protein; putative Phosphoserine phosphatase [Pseudorhizobium banfieldiae]|uniref:Uncharacterized protein n=1 Tax=Pseudorhizobium banfieldiae TaxID=1125847 RepID=L0NCJ4_9HYPH|nr:HAD family hydrolase [Pseudorhizobium banfieldiae]CCF18770.1 conserved hypothetical protein; putative Phosphoserine phosphatase [Pseudorhizobium banfieldiae]
MMEAKQDHQAVTGVVFCDLDGTLVLGNSFHSFLLASWRTAGALQRAQLAHQLALRAFGSRGGGHAGMKRRVLRWFSGLQEREKAEIVERTLSEMRSMVSQPVSNMLKDLRAEGHVVVLATAAPTIYAIPFASSFGFDECLGTLGTETNAVWFELVGERKAQACRQWLSRTFGPCPPAVTVITDHPDDLPLIEIAETIVIQARQEIFEKISGAATGTQAFQLIEPGRVDERGGYWLWFDDRAVGPIDWYEVKTVLSKHRYCLGHVGNGLWQRIVPGMDLAAFGKSVDIPPPPPVRQRVTINAKRRVLRDWLGIFH